VSITLYSMVITDHMK